MPTPSFRLGFQLEILRASTFGHAPVVLTEAQAEQPSFPLFLGFLFQGCSLSRSFRPGFRCRAFLLALRFVFLAERALRGIGWQHLHLLRIRAMKTLTSYTTFAKELK